MAIIIINPNSTVSMTEAMLTAARNVAPDLIFEGWTSAKGPASIQGPEDGAAATPPLLELVRQASDQGADGIIIGCFDDTALQEAAQIAACPVLGIGQAAYHYAALLQKRFSVVTTLAVSVPILEGNIAWTGLKAQLSKVRAADVPVLALETDPDLSGEAIKQEALAAQNEDEIHAVILGCAGMVQVVQEVRAALEIEVIDPVACAARAMIWLTGQGA